MVMGKEAVRATLVDWLESERVRFLELASSIGIPPSVAVSEQVVTKATETSTEYREQERFVSPFYSSYMGEGAELMFAERKRGGAPAIPTALHDHYGDRCSIWCMELIQASAAPPEERARRVAASLTTRTSMSYLRQLESLDRPDVALATTLVDGLLQLVEADHVLFATLLAVAGLRLTVDALEDQGVVVRCLTNEEIGSLLEPYRLSTARLGSRPVAMALPDFASERCLLVVRTPCPKDEQPHSYRAQAVVLALQLLGFDLRGRGFAATYTEPGPTLLSGGQRIRLADFGANIRDFTLLDLKAAVELARLIPEEIFKGPGSRSRREIALHRFASAVCERFPADAIIDFVTALV